MPWSVLVGAACGAIAGVVAALVVRDRKANPIGYLVVMIAGFAALNAVAQQLVVPRIRAWEAHNVAGQLMQENKVLALMSSEHPEVGQQFEAMLVDLVQSGASTDVARARGVDFGRRVVGRYFSEYAARASDESLVAFASVFVDALEQLDAQDPQACYPWLWPGRNAPSGPAVPKAQAEKLSDAMGDVIESAIEKPRHPPAAREAEALRQALVDHLLASRGAEFSASLALLDDPLDPRVDRARACAAATALYRGALEMPEAERGDVLRMLFRGARR